jgi:hypothetical protein
VGKPGLSFNQGPGARSRANKRKPTPLSMKGKTMSEPEKEPTCHCKDYGTELQELAKAVRGLVTLVSVLDKKLDTALKGGIGADFAVM